MGDTEGSFMPYAGNAYGRSSSCVSCIRFVLLRYVFRDLADAYHDWLNCQCCVNPLCWIIRQPVRVIKEILLKNT